MSKDRAQKAKSGQAVEDSAWNEAEEAGAPDIPGEGVPGRNDPGQDNSGQDDPGHSEALRSDETARLEAEVAQLNDRLLRALAECENVRRRAERDRQEAAEFGGTRLARDLLAVYDNLERALSHADEPARETAGAVIEGVELTRRELLNAFAKHKIEKFSPEPGEKFDPHFQQAMYEAPIPGAKPGTVIEAIQAGFTIAGRLLRPALVGVARTEQPAPETATAEDGPESGEGAG